MLVDAKDHSNIDENLDVNQYAAESKLLEEINALYSECSAARIAKTKQQALAKGLNEFQADRVAYSQEVNSLIELSNKLKEKKEVVDQAFVRFDAMNTSLFNFEQWNRGPFGRFEPDPSFNQNVLPKLYELFFNNADDAKLLAGDNDKFFNLLRKLEYSDTAFNILVKSCKKKFRPSQAGELSLEAHIAVLDARISELDSQYAEHLNANNNVNYISDVPIETDSNEDKWRFDRFVTFVYSDPTWPHWLKDSLESLLADFQFSPNEKSYQHTKSVLDGLTQYMDAKGNSSSHLEAKKLVGIIETKLEAMWLTHNSNHRIQAKGNSLVSYEAELKQLEQQKAVVAGEEKTVVASQAFRSGFHHAVGALLAERLDLYFKNKELKDEKAKEAGRQQLEKVEQNIDAAVTKYLQPHLTIEKIRVIVKALKHSSYMVFDTVSELCIKALYPRPLHPCLTSDMVAQRIEEVRKLHAAEKAKSVAATPKVSAGLAVHGTFALAPAVVAPTSSSSAAPAPAVK